MVIRWYSRVILSTERFFSQRGFRIRLLTWATLVISLTFTKFMNVSSVIVSQSGEDVRLPLQTEHSSFSLFTSLAAFGDWIKLFLLGGLFETFRRVLSGLLHQLTESFFVTAEFDEHDETYVWMTFWLSRQKTWSTHHTYRLSCLRYIVLLI